MTLRLADSWIWDSWYAFDGELHHAFYLRASRGLGDPELRHRHPQVGHATSRDLRNWTVLPDALSPSEEPAFDDWTTWTGSVVRDERGTWWMFYTGSTHSDGGLVQRVGAATSEDLITWTKAKDVPILEADFRWYEELDTDLWHDQAWRDPFVFHHNFGMWHMLVTARTKTGPTRDRGVLGHCVSRDLRHWTVLEPLTSPGAGFGQMEVAQVEEVDGTPTLLFSCGTAELSEEARSRYGSGGVFSVTGPSTLGPFDIATATRFPTDSVYAGRLVQHNGSWGLIGFRNIENDEFVGEITDPTPVTSIPGVGLIPIDAFGRSLGGAGSSSGSTMQVHHQS
jgi:beta-fructofuranosidase